MARADRIEGGVPVSGAGNARVSGGITGKGGKNVNPVYNESVHPSKIMITNKTGKPEAYVEKVVNPRPGQKKIDTNKTVIKEKYEGPVSGSSIAKANADAKKLKQMFGH